MIPASVAPAPVRPQYGDARADLGGVIPASVAPAPVRPQYGDARVDLARISGLWNPGPVAYRFLADAVMLAHFGFLVFLAVGGFLAWRWRWVFVPHAAAVGWAFCSVAGAACPLTAWEDGLRRRAGEQGLSRGFVDTYLTDVVYPRDDLLVAQLLLAGLAAASWVGLAVRVHRERPVGAS